jgi:hypothetical protein
MPVSPDQRLLLRSAPALDLALRGDGIRDPLKLLLEDEFDRPTCLGMAVIDTSIVLIYATLQRAPIAARRTDVVAPVLASEHVYKPYEFHF